MPPYKYAAIEAYNPGADRLYDAEILRAANIHIRRLKRELEPDILEALEKKTRQPVRPIAPIVKVEPVEEAASLTSSEELSQVITSAEKPFADSHITVNMPTETPALQWPRAIPSRISPMPPQVQSAPLPISDNLSVYAADGESPLTALHSVKAGQIAKAPHQTSIFKSQTKSSTWQARALSEIDTPNSSLSPSPTSLSACEHLKLTRAAPTHKRKAEHIDFGDRVEQALLKIENWADNWLSGTFNDSNQDLAWNSFESCLRMSDVLDQPERKKIKIEH